MTDSVESTRSRGVSGPYLDSPPADRPPWVLLIHHLPPKPDYLRVKVRRRLERLGALPVKSSVYALPHRPDTIEDFQWLAREIESEGGEATLCEASFLSGSTERELINAFQTARATDYAEIAGAAAALRSDAAPVALARLARRLVAVADIDHFGSPSRRQAELALEAAAHRARATGERADADAADDEALATRAESQGALGRTWVTRSGVYVDRIASAWLIRRFIDRDARFLFVSGSRYRPRPGETRFDMFDAEFTHEGDRCTFETLLARFGLSDSALAALGQIVHDIDLKDEKYGRAETPGVAAVLAGIAATTTDDSARIERGAALFDGLYASLSGAGDKSSA